MDGHMELEIGKNCSNKVNKMEENEERNKFVNR